MSIYNNFDNNKKYELDIEKKFREKFRPIKNNFFIISGLMITSAILGFSVFVFIYWCLSIIDIHYALKSLISCLLACCLLSLINPDMDIKVRIRGASRPYVLMATLISLMIGFKDYGAGVIDDYIRVPKANIYAIDSAAIVSDNLKTTVIESDTLRQKGEIWTTEKNFSVGSSVIIKISKQEIRFVDFYILKPGFYEKIINKNGKLTFKSISDNASVVSVMY